MAFPLSYTEQLCRERWDPRACISGASRNCGGTRPAFMGHMSRRAGQDFPGHGEHRSRGDGGGAA